MNAQRIEKIREQMQARDMDGIALVPGPNLVYFSGIHAHLSERPIILFIPRDALPAIIIPTLEAMKARAAGIPDERILAWSDGDGFGSAFAQAADLLSLSNWRLGVESLYMRVLEVQSLQAITESLHLVPADDAITALRSTKDAVEIAAMERAVAVAEAAMHDLLPRIRVGMTEKEIAGLLTLALMDAGADAPSFGPIVAAGPNSAIPHAVPTDYAVREGELLLFDWGALIDGYASDITRTFAVGEIDAELKRVYEAVRRANEAGKVAVKPGALAQEVDGAARTEIDEAGFGDLFIHRTGHGLGLEVHEEPSLVAGNTTALQAGNVFTVEPGIYLDGRGGVRIEDDVLVTPTGFRSLTSFPRELITLD